MDGPQSAIVTGPAGEEIFCDEHGRVQVRFHWDRYCPGNEDSSCWIRVSQPWAGAGFGHLAIPRVGQEVIVDFLNGDPDQPIIMGRTYHQDNRSPGSLPGTKTQMTIRSKTYKGSGFNELRFEDATGQEQVYIHAQKNMDTEVLNIWHFDGTNWKQLGFPTNAQLATVTCAPDGQVYVSGEGGSLWVGRNESWKKIYSGGSSILWNDAVWFDGKLFLASDYQLRVWNGKELCTVEDNGKAVSAYGHMDAYDGLLVVAGPEFVYSFDGTSWRLLVAPYLD